MLVYERIDALALDLKELQQTGGKLWQLKNGGGKPEQLLETYMCQTFVLSAAEIEQSQLWRAPFVFVLDGVDELGDKRELVPINAVCEESKWSASRFVECCPSGYLDDAEVYSRTAQRNLVLSSGTL